MACASCLSLLVLVAMASAASGQLSSTFYDTSCPNALSTIKSAVTAAVSSEARMGASLVRLHFHDCFVDGCDGSVLLADTGSFIGEQGAAPNNGSIRGMNVIDNIKTQVEAVCNQTVSCADILAVAARDSVVAVVGLGPYLYTAISRVLSDKMRVLAKLQRVGVPARRTVCAYVLASSTLLPISLLLLARSILQLAQHLQLTYAKNRLIATGTYRAFAFFVFLTLAHGRLQGSYKGLYSSRLANLVELGILNLLQLVFRIPLVYDTEATHDAVWRSTCLILTALGGPTWTVLLGRRDSTTASKTNAERDLPPPSFDLTNLTTAFANKQLSVTDMVALSGAHTIGQSQCLNFRDRLYNETNIDTTFATSLKANCPRPTGSGDGSLAPLDTTTPNAFDNAYYTNLMSQKGLLHSDQVLFNGGSTDNTVRNFASSAAAFSSAFATAMVNMGNIAPKTGTQGQIRLTCSKVNS